MNSALVLVSLQFGTVGLAMTILILAPVTAAMILIIAAVRHIRRKNESR